MEEMIKILNGIILKHRTNLVESTPDYNSASEIASLVRGFEEWKFDKVEAKLEVTGKGGDVTIGGVNYTVRENGMKFKTLDELFSYWYTNVRKEEK